MQVYSKLINRFGYLPWVTLPVLSLLVTSNFMQNKSVVKEEFKIDYSLTFFTSIDPRKGCLNILYKDLDKLINR